VNLCHFFDFCHPKNPYEKYTPPYGTARGDPILMEGTVPWLKVMCDSCYPWRVSLQDHEAMGAE
jgi:hypothetical protein